MMYLLFICQNMVDSFVLSAICIVKIQIVCLPQPTEFWGEIAKSYVEWMEPFHTVSNCDLPNGKISWFEGGKLNASGKLLCTVYC